MGVAKAPLCNTVSKTNDKGTKYKEFLSTTSVDADPRFLPQIEWQIHGSLFFARFLQEPHDPQQPRGILQVGREVRRGRAALSAGPGDFRGVPGANTPQGGDLPAELCGTMRNCCGPCTGSAIASRPCFFRAFTICECEIHTTRHARIQ
jgi:hypothetical protein